MPSPALVNILARVIADQALRQLEAQKNNRPSVDTAEPAYTPERTPAQRGPANAK